MVENQDLLTLELERKLSGPAKMWYLLSSNKLDKDT